MKTYFLIGIRLQNEKVVVSDLYPSFIAAFNASEKFILPYLGKIKNYTIKELTVLE